MKIAVIFAVIALVAGSDDDGRPKRSLLAATPLSAYPAFYGAAPYAPTLYAPSLYAPSYPISPVVARASTVVGVPGFAPRYPYGYGYGYGYPYAWPGTPTGFLRR